MHLVCASKRPQQVSHLATWLAPLLLVSTFLHSMCTVRLRQIPILKSKLQFRQLPFGYFESCTSPSIQNGRPIWRDARWGDKLRDLVRLCFCGILPIVCPKLRDSRCSRTPSSSVGSVCVVLCRKKRMCVCSWEVAEGTQMEQWANEYTC